jgi:hypothetical protein
MKLPLYAFTICLFTLVHVSNAQITIGLKGGFSVFQAKFEGTVQQTDPGLRYQAGLIMRIKIAGNFYLQPELLYAQKGWSYSKSQFYSEKTNIMMDYINVPVLAGLNVSKHLSVFTGPELGYLLSSRTRPGGSAGTDGFNRVDTGVLLGGSWNITNQIGIDLRYIYGFKYQLKGEFQMDPNEPPIPISFQSSGNHGVQFSIFYLFGKE